MRILLVDDDPLVLKSCARLLMRKGHVVTATLDGHAADLDGLRYDAAVVDLHLAGAAHIGIDTGARLLANGATERVLFYTGGAEPSEVERARRLGPVVVKGRPEALLAALGEPMPESA